MWIRDTLPHLFPMIRFASYGYETKLYPSTSFQSVPDLAISLVDALKSCGWSSPTAKPLVFLAHSLGGIVLKQALVMLAGSGGTEKFIHTLVRGCIFFGVPSRGMPMNDIKIMLGKQPNADTLVAEISDTSEYLQTLERQFSGISFLRTVKVYWAYETKTTKAVFEVSCIVYSSLSTQRLTMTCCQEVGGGFTRSGSDVILVTKESATGGRCTEDPLSTVPVDENHSDMVKFSHGDHRIRNFAYKLGEICGATPQPMVVVDNQLHVDSPPQKPEDGPYNTAQLAMPEFPQWDNQSKSYPGLASYLLSTSTF